uniref:ERCC4 domain-containing protein n=1 Tax=viral metagenome TaxID=1070528 RepID=A0A6C0D1Q1_9ZZZZ
MAIIIDFREKDILKHCTEMNKNQIEIKTENLLLGDILIDKLLIERKTINDLAASIVDGRYKEQSFRLVKALEEGYRVFYFIEGNMDLYTGAISKNILVSSIYSLTHKGFQVLLTKNSKDTAFFILQFSEKMKKDSEKMKKKQVKDELTDDQLKDEASESVDIKVSIVNEKTYENTQGVIQTKKNKNITKDNISVFMLCQIPGISTTTAGILLEKYNHISKLIIAMKENPTEIEDFRNNNKKLNKNIIKNLNEFLNHF